MAILIYDSFSVVLFNYTVILNKIVHIIINILESNLSVSVYKYTFLVQFSNGRIGITKPYRFVKNSRNLNITLDINASVFTTNNFLLITAIIMIYTFPADVNAEQSGTVKFVINNNIEIVIAITEFFYPLESLNVYVIVPHNH